MTDTSQRQASIETRCGPGTPHKTPQSHCCGPLTGQGHTATVLDGLNVKELDRGVEMQDHTVTTDLVLLIVTALGLLAVKVLAG